MLSQRQRAVVWAVAALVGIWVVAAAGYHIAKNSKMTAAKVQAFIDSLDFTKLSGDARAKALKDLADKINRLSAEERQKFRADRMTERWFDAMTEEEKGQFIEATMPTGFKQMISAFEEMPEDKRRKAIDDALKGLRKTNERLQAGGANVNTNRPPISPELEAKVRTIGLKTFYSQSSAQTKAELAPVLEELQKTMESGRYQRGR